MRKLLSVLLAVLLVVVFVPTAFAGDCPRGQFLRKIGSTQTASAVISTSGHDVRLISVLSTSSAGVAGLYNADDLGGDSVTGTVIGNLVIEVGAAASDIELIPETGFLIPLLGLIQVSFLWMTARILQRSRCSSVDE